MAGRGYKIIILGSWEAEGQPGRRPPKSRLPRSRPEWQASAISRVLSPGGLHIIACERPTESRRIRNQLPRSCRFVKGDPGFSDLTVLEDNLCAFFASELGVEDFMKALGTGRKGEALSNRNGQHMQSRRRAKGSKAATSIIPNASAEIRNEFATEQRKVKIYASAQLRVLWRPR